MTPTLQLANNGIEFWIGGKKEFDVLVRKKSQQDLRLKN